ncbi:MAG: hypothetical protein MKZ70_02045, partial [Opitutales bacterium]|nr:hypothetical protein [Opitutales bacterium]
MTDNVTHIPALRFGEAYKSMDTNDLGTVLKSGNSLEVSVVNAGIIRRDKLAIELARESLRKIPAETLLDYAEKASEIYLEDELAFGMNGETQTVADYVTALSGLTGLPHSLCRS